MRLHGKTIGVGITGSFCTIPSVLPELQRLRDEGAVLFAIVSPLVLNTDTRFMLARDLRDALCDITGNTIIESIPDAEPIGPRNLLDLMIVAPCTGNTLAKLAHGITDSPVLMAVKAQLRNEEPVVLGVSTNDGLSANLANIGILLNRKHIYMVPFRQDNPRSKPSSLVARMDLLLDTVVAAFEGRQMQPVLADEY